MSSQWNTIRNGSLNKKNCQKGVEYVTKNREWHESNVISNKKVALGFAFMYNIHQNQACYVFYQLCYAIHHVTYLVIMWSCIQWIQQHD